MVAMTPRSSSITTRLAAWPHVEGRAAWARRTAARAWADEPALSRFADPGAAALSARSFAGSPVLAALAARSADTLAMTTALAALAPDLVRVVRQWSSAGMPTADLVDSEADQELSCRLARRQ